MSDEVIQIYSVPAVDDYLSLLDSLTPAARAVFEGLFQPGTLDGEAIYYAEVPDSLHSWFISDLPEQPGPETPNQILLPLGGEFVEVMVNSGYFGGDFISA